MRSYGHRFPVPDSRDRAINVRGCVIWVIVHRVVRVSPYVIVPGSSRVDRRRAADLGIGDGDPVRVVPPTTAQAQP